MANEVTISNSFNLATWLGITGGAVLAETYSMGTGAEAFTDTPTSEASGGSKTAFSTGSIAWTDIDVLAVVNPDATDSLDIYLNDGTTLVMTVPPESVRVINPATSTALKHISQGSAIQIGVVAVNLGS